MATKLLYYSSLEDKMRVYEKQNEMDLKNQEMQLAHNRLAQILATTENVKPPGTSMPSPVSQVSQVQGAKRPSPVSQVMTQLSEKIKNPNLKSTPKSSPKKEKPKSPLFIELEEKIARRSASSSTNSSPSISPTSSQAPTVATTSMSDIGTLNPSDFDLRSDKAATLSQLKNFISIVENNPRFQAGKKNKDAKTRTVAPKYRNIEKSITAAEANKLLSGFQEKYSDLLSGNGLLPRRGLRRNVRRF